MRTRVLIAAAGTALVVAGCSSGGGSNGAGGAGESSGQTVQVQEVGGMSDVLTDSSGKTLYVSEQESGGEVLCSSSDCTAIWVPLTIAGGEQPTGPDAVAGKLGTVMRPDGETQVTLDGAPLYTFTLDSGAGQTAGEGVSDTFDGTDFTWHVATASGAGGGMSTQSPSGGYQY